MLRKNRFVIISVHWSKCCGDMPIFQDGGRRRLAFLIFEVLMVEQLKRVKMRRCAKFCRNQSKCGGDMTIFRFFMMAAAAILDFQNFKL